jgi:hypothetical protein
MFDRRSAEIGPIERRPEPCERDPLPSWCGKEAIHLCSDAAKNVFVCLYRCFDGLSSLLALDITHRRKQ